LNVAISIKKSTKSIGKYEAPLISRLCEHFESLGFKAFPHVRLNIAWGSCLSDIDILLIRDSLVTVIEVKSYRDKLARAEKQLEAISDYVDYSYVATDRLPRHWKSSRSGLLLIKDDVRVVKRASKIVGEPKLDSLIALPKKCLLRFLGQPHQERLLKYEIALRIRNLFDDESIRQCLKEIVLCQGCSHNECPILGLVSSIPCYAYS
jgi:hypothetical protein